MDHQELLKSMLQDVINDKEDNARVTMHDYFVSKTRDVAGLKSAPVAESEPDDNEDGEQD